MIQRIGRNIFSLGLSRVISGIIIFVVYIKLVIYLGPHEFGKFALVLTYYVIFSLLVDLGISKYVIKKISEDKNLAAPYLGNFFVSQFLISLLALILFILMPRILNYETDVASAMLLAGIGLLVGSLSNPLSSLVQAWQKIHILAAVNFFNTIINAGWLMFAIYTGQNFVFTFWIYLIVGIFDLLIYAVAAKKIISLHEVSSSAFWQKDLIGKMLVYGIPFAFISGFEILIAKADSIIQKVFLPYSEVGLYAGAYRFIDALTFVPAVVAISLFPYIAEKINLVQDEVKDTLERWNRYLVILAIPMGIGATILADQIILTLFDERYLASVKPFQILIWSAVITFIYAVPNVIMIVKKTRQALWVLSFSTIFNIITNLIFVPRFGIIASAWLTVASYFFVAWLYIVISRRLSDYKLVGFAFWPAIASIPMGILVWQLKALNFLLVAGIGAIVYFTILILVGFLKKTDWFFVKSIFIKP